MVSISLVLLYRHSDSELLLTDTTFPAFFGAVSTILAVLTGVARIGTCAYGGKQIKRNLIDENN
jgi:hypothetical protein